jgi:hypothetical protein
MRKHLFARIGVFFLREQLAQNGENSEEKIHRIGTNDKNIIDIIL